MQSKELRESGSYRDGRVQPHFVGSIVYPDKGGASAQDQLWLAAEDAKLLGLCHDDFGHVECDCEDPAGG
jgi:hypothetical protein